METDEVRRLFDRALEVPAPASSASIHTAVARGRRRERGRRYAAVALSGIIAIAVAAGTVALTGAGEGARRSAPPAAAASSTWSPEPTPPTTAPPPFDPHFVHAHIGWLPADLQIYSVDSGEQSYGAAYQYKPEPGTISDGQVLSLSLAQPGDKQSHAVRDQDWPTTPAAPVGGHPAVWVHPPGESTATAILRWSYGTDASATVRVDHLRGGLDAQETAHHVADTVQIGTFEPVTTPFQLARIPASATLSSVRFQIQDDASMPWESSLSLSSGETNIDVHVFAKPDCVCGGKYDTDSNTTVNGIPAWLAETSVTLYYGAVIAEIDVNPVLPPDATADDARRAIHAGLGSLSLTDLAAALSVYPDRADWRTPLRP